LQPVFFLRRQKKKFLADFRREKTQISTDENREPHAVYRITQPGDTGFPLINQTSMDFARLFFLFLVRHKKSIHENKPVVTAVCLFSLFRMPEQVLF
jgi:hypothetical protein